MALFETMSTRVARNGKMPSTATHQAIMTAQAMEATAATAMYTASFLPEFTLVSMFSPRRKYALHSLYGNRARKKFPTNPPMLPGLKVPKKSPIRFPIAAPQAPAGPNRSPKTTGNTFAGLSSTAPGMMGKPLNGIKTAA
jgi:hypothetical protein